MKVSEAVVVKRLRRKLAKEHLFLRRVRSVSSDFGYDHQYFVLNDFNDVVCIHLDLDDFARQEGLLDASETVEGF